MPMLAGTDQDTPPSSHPPVTGVPASIPRQAPPARLGEELPIFCEKCGYSLHGLPQARCDRCDILHYACPECNHHQPINTMRPAVQRILGRLRAFALGFWVLVKLNFFGWLLFAWGAMGGEWAYRYGHVGGGRGPSTLVVQPIDIESMAAFATFGLLFGVFSRMLLLRWRKGAYVGLVLAAVVALAATAGATLRWIDATSGRFRSIPGPLSTDLPVMVAWGGGFIVLGAMIVWPIWLSLVHLFLPKRTAQALLDWQRALSLREPPKREPALARD